MRFRAVIQMLVSVPHAIMQQHAALGTWLDLLRLGVSWTFSSQRWFVTTSQSQHDEALLISLNPTCTSFQIRELFLLVFGFRGTTSTGTTTAQSSTVIMW
jgi:hypothetical protein